MKKYLNLSVVASLVIVTLSCNAANAKTNQSSLVKKGSVVSSSADESVRVFVNNQQRSLYQIALLSGISISELREINKGEYDNVDVVKIGDSIILPANSPLLPAETAELKKEDKYSYLPTLGSSDTVEIKSNDDIVETQVASVLQTLGQQDWENMSAEKVKEDLKNDSRDYAENYVRNQVHSQVIDPIRSAAQDFLGRFGTAQLQFDVSDQGRLNNVNVKLFSPWYDSDDMLLFSQLTFQEYEKDRRIGNFGIGQRWDVADKTWLLGYNVFLDHDFSRNHNRLGLGLEAWADYMKFAANYYTPLSDWKDSKDFDDYLERAARGFDIRFQGYLPSYPHLGGSLMFEQYFGDKVALFGKDYLQKDPYAVTVGVDYTPVPLFTIKGEHKQGQEGKKAAKVELTMNYRLGVPLNDQLDANMVDVARSLKGSRYDLVDRNNYIVLEYKEKKFSVDLAAIGLVEEETVIPLGISVHNAKNGVTIAPSSWNNITGLFDLTALASVGAAGDLCYNRIGVAPCTPANLWSAVTTSDTNNWSVLVPKYINTNTGELNPTPTSGVKEAGRYTFDVTLTDGNGRIATSNTTWMQIKPSGSRSVLLSNISAIGGGGVHPIGHQNEPAMADGNDIVQIEARLDNAGVGFHDFYAFKMYPPVGTTSAPAPLPLLHTELIPLAAITATDIAKLNELYSIKSGSNKVTLLNGNVHTSCPTTTPNCLLVQEITAIAGENTNSVDTDMYRMKVTTTAALGKVDIEYAFPHYSSVGTESIYFTGGLAARIDIFDSANNLIAQDLTGSGVLTMHGTLMVGETYSAEAYYTSGNQIVNPDITWSLVGNNSGASCSPATTLPSSPTGPWFNVSSGPNSSYTIKGVGTSLVSTTGVGLTVPSLGSPMGDPVTAAPLACAGDQGFALQVTVK